MALAFDHTHRLWSDPAPLLDELFPRAGSAYRRRGWRWPDRFDRVYDSSRAQRELSWSPQYNFAEALEALERDRNPRSELAMTIGAKGYHEQTFSDGPYPV